jgi:hypothetical protein
MDLRPDFEDLLSALAATNAEYLVVGGWAVGYDAEPCFTKDLDVLIGPSNENLVRAARRDEVPDSHPRAIGRNVIFRVPCPAPCW